jgi:hypothetical protein
MRFDEVMAMWKKDSQINEMNLDEASIDSAKLHAKYLDIYNFYRHKLMRKEMDFKVLLKNKFLWYNGKLSKDEMDALGWEYDALNGLKILKGEMDYYYDADPHIQEMNIEVEQLKMCVDSLKEIMDQIKWRHQSVRNAIEWRKFTSGA